MTGTVRSGKHEVEWITISVDEYESMRRTIDVLSDRVVIEQIREAKKGRAKPVISRPLLANSESEPHLCKILIRTPYCDGLFSGP